MPQDPTLSISVRVTPEINREVSEVIKNLVNPIDLFSGAKAEDAMFAENIVVFKRTSTSMLRPQGVTHNYHHRFELVIPLMKPGRIHVDGLGYMLSPGQAFLIFPHQFHHYLDIEGGEISWLFITFEFFRPQQLASLRNSPRGLSAEDFRFLQQLMKEYLDEAPGPNRNFKLIVNVSELLRRLSLAREAHCSATRDGSGDSRGDILESINKYVRANLNKPLAIADLAKHTGYSISYLRAVFREEFGVSLGGYMRDSRLSIAASMLSGTERDSIENIAKACGFVSIFAFSRAFKKAMGVSPSVYSKFIKGSPEMAT